MTIYLQSAARQPRDVPLSEAFMLPWTLQRLADAREPGYRD